MWRGPARNTRPPPRSLTNAARFSSTGRLMYDGLTSPKITTSYANSSSRLTGNTRSAVSSSSTYSRSASCNTVVSSNRLATARLLDASFQQCLQVAKLQARILLHVQDANRLIAHAHTLRQLVVLRVRFVLQAARHPPRIRTRLPAPADRTAGPCATCRRRRRPMSAGPAPRPAPAAGARP